MGWTESIIPRSTLHLAHSNPTNKHNDQYSVRCSLYPFTNMRSLLGKRGEALQSLMNFLVVVPVFLAMGFSLSFLGGVTRYKTFYTLFPKINTVTTTGAVKSHNSLIQGTSVSSLNLGAALGCLSTMYLGNKLGRRRTVMLGAIITLVGTALQCSAFSLAQLIISRREWLAYLSPGGNRR